MAINKNPDWYKRDGATAKQRRMSARLKESQSVLETIGVAADRALITGNVSTSASSATVTITGGTFATDIVGKVIVIPGAGAETAPSAGTYYPHVAVVTARASSASITISAAAVTTVSTSLASFGTDAGPGINTAIAVALAAGVKLQVPGGNYLVATTVELSPDSYINFQRAKFWGATGSSPIVLVRSAVCMTGKLYLDGNSVAGIVGIQFGANLKNCEQSYCNKFEIDNCTVGALFYSSGGSGNSCYHNTVHRIRARHCTNAGIKFLHDSANGTGNAPYRVNANWITHASLQNNTGAAAVIVDGGDANAVGFLEAESNSGASTIALDLRRCNGFSTCAGWFEGNTVNLKLADYPAVAGSVEFCASCDSSLTSTDAKFVYTFSSQRSLLISNAAVGWKHVGRARFAGLTHFGLDGVAADDQGTPGAYKVGISGGIDLYRFDGTTQYFNFRLSLGGVKFVTDGGSTSLIDITSARASIPVAANIGNHPAISTHRLAVYRNDGNPATIRLTHGDTGGTAAYEVERSSSIRSAQYRMYTSGALNWSAGLCYDSGATSVDYHITTDTTAANSKLRVTTTGNLGINGYNSFGNGIGVVGVPDATAPTNGPTAGLAIYSVSGGLRYRGADGEKRLDYLLASATVDPASLTTGSQSTTATITVTGLALGDFVRGSFSLDMQGLTLHAWASSANTVSYFFRNDTGGTVDLASGTLRIQAWRA